MEVGSWIKKFPAAVTVCDAGGMIVEMNDKACKVFEKDGGEKLIGKNVLDCHPEKARQKLKEMLENHTANCYTIEKNGVKKMIYQSPWYEGDEYRGIVEIVMELPPEVPHFKR